MAPFPRGAAAFRRLIWLLVAAAIVLLALTVLRSVSMLLDRAISHDDAGQPQHLQLVWSVTW